MKFKDMPYERIDFEKAKEELKGLITALKEAKELESMEVDNVLFGLPIAIKVDKFIPRGCLSKSALFLAFLWANIFTQKKKQKKQFLWAWHYNLKTSATAP